MGDIAVSGAFRVDLSSPGVPARGALYGAGLSHCRDASGRRNEKIYAHAAIGVVEQGCFSYGDGSEEGFAAPGAILFGNAGDVFACRHFDNRGNCRAVVAFSDRLIGEIAGEAGIDNPRFAAALLPPTPRNTAWGAAIRCLVQSAVVDDDAAYELAAAALSLGREFDSSAPLARDAARMVDVIHYIEINFAQPCGLALLAALAGISRYHFLRLFRTMTGVSPAQYVIAQRLRAAASRLRDSSDPVTAIAYDSGFNDLSHFNLLFRRSFGMAPQRWRTSRAVRH